MKKKIKTRFNKFVLPDYTQKAIASLKKAAGGVDQPYIYPRAYCLAKPHNSHAIFAVPTQDRAPENKNEKFVCVQNRTAEQCISGEWYSLVYVINKAGYGEYRVVGAEVGPKQTESEPEYNHSIGALTGIVSLDDAMPDDGQDVLWIWANAGQIAAGSYSKGKLLDISQNYAEIDPHSYPSHWMPWPVNWP